jgi:acetoin utilization deacetylase AcuC-like enzyme
MSIIFHPDFDIPFQDFGIGIPIVDDRSVRVFEELQKENSQLKIFDLDEITPLSHEDLLLAHNQSFVEDLFGAELDGQLKKTYELIDQQGNPHRYFPEKAKRQLHEIFPLVLLQAGGTYTCLLQALAHQNCFYLSGGMHHAMSFGGRGFCLVNDIVIALRKARSNNLIDKGWVIDIDAHKGDGTAELLKDDENFKTLSIHMAKGWPLDNVKKDDPCFIPSDIDIPMGAGEEDQYCQRLLEGLEELEKSSCPEVAIVVAGADPYEKDQLPSSSRLKLTKEQMLERDLIVHDFLKDRNIAQLWLLAGGYGPYSWEIYHQFLVSATGFMG